MPSSAARFASAVALLYLLAFVLVVTRDALLPTLAAPEPLPDLPPAVQELEAEASSGRAPAHDDTLTFTSWLGPAQTTVKCAPPSFVRPSSILTLTTSLYSPQVWRAQRLEGPQPARAAKTARVPVDPDVRVRPAGGLSPCRPLARPGLARKTDRLIAHAVPQEAPDQGPRPPGPQLSQGLLRTPG